MASLDAEPDEPRGFLAAPTAPPRDDRPFHDDEPDFDATIIEDHEDGVAGWIAENVEIISEEEEEYLIAVMDDELTEYQEMVLEAVAEDFDGSEAATAAVLVTLYHEQIRYVPSWKAWLVWDGRCWRRDTSDQILGLAIEAVNLVDWARRLRVGCAPLVNEKLLQKMENSLQQWRIKFLRRRTLLDVLALAQPGCAIEADTLDADPWLFNCANGTIDLRTGNLRPHDPQDLLTRISEIDYDPRAQCPRFENLLDWCACGDASLVAYLHRAFGYCLTGSVREQNIFVCHGDGDNGKSTLLGAVMGVMGPHADRVEDSVVLQRRFESVNSDEVAKLHGLRFALVSEPELGSQLAEARIKQLTGSGRIHAMRKYEHAFTFEPTHKLWMDTNHKPRVRGTDRGIRRRIHLIPFDNQVQDSQKDPDLGEKLSAEAVGILAWLVRGCLAYQQQGGLLPPARVNDATQAYLEENDTVGLFLDEACTVTGQDSDAVPCDEAYRKFQQWSQSRGVAHPMAAQTFKAEFGKREGIRKAQKSLPNGTRPYVFSGVKVHGRYGITPALEGRD